MYDKEAEQYTKQSVAELTETQYENIVNMLIKINRKESKKMMEILKKADEQQLEKVISCFTL